MGNIGPSKTVEYEPMPESEPVVEPAHVTTPEPEPVPA